MPLGILLDAGHCDLQVLWLGRTVSLLPSLASLYSGTMEARIQKEASGQI